MNDSAPAVVEASFVLAPDVPVHAPVASFVEPAAALDTGPPFETRPRILPLRL